MSTDGDKTVVSGPPEAPVALLDQLRKSLERERSRHHESVSQFILSRLKTSGIIPAGLEDLATDLSEEPEGPYQLGRIVATGGMGAIISATDQNLRRDVAMKVVLNGAEAKTELIQRLVTEARITGQLQHPNIVPLYELGVTEDGVVYYTMRLVEGTTLNDVLGKIRNKDAETIRRFPLPVLLTAFQKICDAVAFAHSRGVVHRDLKPDNIMLGGFGEVMVMDWGLAKVIGADGDESDTTFAMREDIDQINDDTYQTVSGAIKGTPRYMAPEQAMGQSFDIDERTDIYALGAILYSILTLHPPVSGDSVDKVLKRVATGAIAAPTEYNLHSATTILGGEMAGGSKPIQPPLLEHCPDRRIPASLSAVAMKSLARRKTNRYRTVAALQEDISAYQLGFATTAESAGALRLLWLLLRRHRTESLLISTALVTIVVLVAWFTSRVTAALNELKEAAPSFYVEARALSQEVKFAKALLRVNYAIKLRPEEPRFNALKGNLHQSLFQFDEAAAAYRNALEINPSLPYVKENLDLSTKLLKARRSDGVLSTNLLTELMEAMRRQRRTAESLALNTRLSRNQDDIFVTWRAIIFKAGLRGPLKRIGHRKISLKINNPEAEDLDPIREMPLLRLDISGTQIQDLTPLADHQLEELNVANSRVTDLSKISAMPLEKLNLSQTKIASLDPLAELPLKTLNLSSNSIPSLAALTDLPLEELRLDGCVGITDFTPLTSLKNLKRLILPAVTIPDGLLEALPNLSKIGTNWTVDGWKAVPDAADLRDAQPDGSIAPPGN
jgi:serine/threonine protein kinase